MKQPALLVALALVASCADGPAVGEQTGKAGRVVFSAETELAFTQRLVVGSRFPISVRALATEDAAAVAGARLETSNASVFEVADGVVRTLGPGEADLVVVGTDGELDRITLRAATGSTTLVSGALLAATGTVDARLPGTFALRTDVDTTLFVSAVDACGDELLDLHASTLEVSGEVPVAVDAAKPAAFVVATQVPGDVDLTLKTPGLEDLVFHVRSADSSQVDEVDVAVSAADGDTVTLFGRAFVDDLEVVSPLTFSWAGATRVALEQTEGQAVRARIAFPAEGEPPDDSPATATAELFGESGSIDVLTATLTTSIGSPARAPAVAQSATPLSCERGGCSVEAALAWFGVRRLRRLRRVPHMVRALQGH